MYFPYDSNFILKHIHIGGINLKEALLSLFAKLSVSYHICQNTFQFPLREGVTKTIESVIMIIPDRVGGGLRVVIIPSKKKNLNAPNLVVWLY